MADIQFQDESDREDAIRHGARGLALHRMMRDGSNHWDDLSEVDRLSLYSEAEAVLKGVEVMARVRL